MTDARIEFDELAGLVRAQAAELERLRGEVAALRRNGNVEYGSATGGQPVSRRRFLGRAGAVAVGAAGAAVAAGVVSPPAEADVGDPLRCGNYNTAGSFRTELHQTSGIDAAPQVLRVRDGATGIDWSLFPGVLVGYGQRGRPGVRGVAKPNGNGVIGESTKDAGLLGTSAEAQGVVGSGATYGGDFKGTKAALRLAPQSFTGKPTTGSHMRGELLCDAAGALWFCTGSGTPGTWKKVSLA